MLHFFCSTRKDFLHSIKKKKFNDHFLHSMKKNFNDYFFIRRRWRVSRIFFFMRRWERISRIFFFHSNKWLLTKNSCSFWREQMTMNIVNLHWNASKSHFHFSISISIFVLILVLILVLIFFSIFWKFYCSFNCSFFFRFFCSFYRSFFCSISSRSKIFDFQLKLISSNWKQWDSIEWWSRIFEIESKTCIRNQHNRTKNSRKINLKSTTNDVKIS